MRLSVLKYDSGYKEDAYCGNYEAYLDGEKVDGCITADEEKGLVHKYKLDEEGNFVFGHDNGEKYLKTETLYGNVEIRKAE